MKSLLGTVVQFLSFLLSLILISCSSENTITAPTNDKSAAMEKTAVIPTVTINRSTDTVIVLPKSKISIVLSKTYTADQIAKIDAYLTTHSIQLMPAGVKPNLQSCNQHSETDWMNQDIYQSIPGKYLGVWTSKIDWTLLHDTYGYTNIAIYPGQESTALNDHYKNYDSMLVALSPSVTQSQINSYPNYSNYFEDEPYDYAYMTSQQFVQLANWIYLKNSNAQLFFSDFWWPEFDLSCFPHDDNGNTLQTYWFPNNHVHIMCDQYAGNGCGSIDDFWNEYKLYYSYNNRSNSNFISLDYSDYWWGCCVDAGSWASPGYFDHLWVYADGANGSEASIKAFNPNAWFGHWILRYQLNANVLWVCNGDCTTCQWPNVGTWTIQSIYYLGASQWASY